MGKSEAVNVVSVSAAPSTDRTVTVARTPVVGSFLLPHTDATTAVRSVYLLLRLTKPAASRPWSPPANDGTAPAGDVARAAAGAGAGFSIVFALSLRPKMMARPR